MSRADPPIATFRRDYPSANSVLLLGTRPVLVDTGFGADVADLLAWLDAVGTPPDRLALIVNSHHHSDHVGGNHRLQTRHGIPIAAAVADAVRINRCDRDACDAVWLRQPVERYRVDRPLSDGEEIDTGGVRWRVVATPGHTPSHLSLFDAESGTLVAGDALHDHDIGWIAPCHDGAGMLAATAATLARLAALPICRAVSGHGSPIADPAASLARAGRRLASWQADPARIVHHACRRIFSHALIVDDGWPEASIGDRLLDAPWFRDHADALDLTPEAFVPALLADMLRSRAAAWRDGVLRATAPYRHVPHHVWSGPTDPARWTE